MSNVPNANVILNTVNIGSTVPWNTFAAAASAALGGSAKSLLGLVAFASPTAVSRPTSDQLIVDVTAHQSHAEQGGTVTTTDAQVSFALTGNLQVTNISGLHVEQGPFGGQLKQVVLADAPNNEVEVTVTVHVALFGDQTRSFLVDQNGQLVP